MLDRIATGGMADPKIMRPWIDQYKTGQHNAMGTHEFTHPLPPSDDNVVAWFQAGVNETLKKA